MEVEWIKRQLREQPDKSQAGLARHLGLNPSGINRLLKGERRIQAVEVSKIEEYFGAPPAVLPQRSLPPATSGLLESGNPWRGLEPIPVMGTGEAGKDGLVEWNGEVIDHVARPPALAGAVGAYAIYVVGESMVPRYQHGELVYVHPGRPITHGSFVVAQMRHGEDAQPGVLIKQFLRRNQTALTLHQFNPNKDLSYPSATVMALHRIVASGEA